jgi:hypothetical protein
LQNPEFERIYFATRCKKSGTGGHFCHDGVNQNDTVTPAISRDGTAIPARERPIKSNAQGFKTSWNGCKLHLDTADCGVPIRAMLSSASMLT